MLNVENESGQLHHALQWNLTTTVKEYKYCGLVLVVIIYYKLWKERHTTHNNGQRLVDAQLVHKSLTSVQ